MSANGDTPAEPRLSDVQDVEVNYYVLVPFTTVAAAEWAARRIAAQFDCHVVSVEAVDQSAPLAGETA